MNETTEAIDTAESDATLAMPDAIQYGVLKQTNGSYMGKVWRTIEALYKGGFFVDANEHLPRLSDESLTRYEDRKKCAAYINYFGQVVDYFAAALFTQEIQVTEAADAGDKSSPGGKAQGDYYTGFANNCDRKGTTFQKTLRDVFTNAIKKKRALLALDFPRIDPDAPAPVNRLEEEARGVDTAYCYEVPIEQLLDWEMDERGRFAWCILLAETEVRKSPLTKRDTVVETFKVWTMTDDGFAKWDTYAISHKPGNTVSETKDVDRVDFGITSFRRIPLLMLEVPDGLWVGNKIGALSLEHFQRRTCLVAAENKSLFAIPVAKLGTEIGSPGGPVPSAVQQNPSRGHDPKAEFEARGYVAIGSEDSIEFAEPSGSAYLVIDNQLKDLKDEIFRIVHQMAASVDNSASSMRRSGESKQQDHNAEAIVLGAFGSLCRDFACLTYTTISDARGEDVVWTPHGLTDYETESRDVLIAEAVQVDMVDIPSVTWKKSYKTSLALKLTPNLPPETQDQIRKEIESGVTEQHSLDTAVEKAKGEASIASSNATTENPQGATVQKPKVPPPVAK